MMSEAREPDDPDDVDFAAALEGLADGPPDTCQWI